MEKVNKYRYLKVIQGNYGYGWDDLVEYDTSNKDYRKELKEDFKAYRENEANASHRIINRRELIESKIN